MQRPVFFGSSGNLFGILSEPESTAATGVVLIHGWSGYRDGPHRMFVKLARAICDTGCACLRFDFSGRGDSAGEYEGTTLDIMIDDTVAAVALLREQTRVRSVVLCGICSGGNVALGAASLDKTIAGLALLSTPLFRPQKEQLSTGDRSRYRMITHYAAKVCKPQAWYKLARGLVDFRGVGRALESCGEADSRKDSKRDVMRDLAGYTGRMLFIYGSKDTESTGAPGYYRGYTGSTIQAQFETIEGSDHNFYTAAWENKVVDSVCRWISSLPRIRTGCG